jgi:protein TonB
MQHLATHSKKLHISWALAFALNIAIAFGFAQLFKTYTIKTSKIYTIYLVSKTDTQLTQKNKNPQSITKNQDIQIKPVSDKFASTKKSLISTQQKTNYFQKTQINNAKISTKNHLESQSSPKIIQNTRNQLTNYQNNATFSLKNSSILTNTGDSPQNPTDIQTQPQITSWIENHKFYPQEAIFRGEEGKIQLVFVIDKNGALQNISVLKKSPYDSLNKAAVKIVHNSSPVPKKLLTNVDLPFYAKINIIFKLE